MKYISFNVKNQYKSNPADDEVLDVLFHLSDGIDDIRNLAFHAKGRPADEHLHLLLVPMKKWDLFDAAFRKGGLSFWGLIGLTSGAYRKALLKYGGSEPHKAIFESGSAMPNWSYFGRYDSTSHIDYSIYTTRIASLGRYAKVFLENTTMLGDPSYIIQMQISEELKITGKCKIKANGNKSTAGSKTIMPIVDYLKKSDGYTNQCKGGKVGEAIGRGLGDVDETDHLIRGINGGGGGGGIIIIETRRISAGFITDNDNKPIPNELIIEANGGFNKTPGGGGMVILSYEQIDPEVTIKIRAKGAGGNATNGWIEVFEKGVLKATPDTSSTSAVCNPTDRLTISTVNHLPSDAIEYQTI